MHRNITRVRKYYYIIKTKRTPTSTGISVKCIQKDLKSLQTETQTVVAAEMRFQLELLPTDFQILSHVGVSVTIL